MELKKKTAVDLQFSANICCNKAVFVDIDIPGAALILIVSHYTTFSTTTRHGHIALYPFCWFQKTAHPPSP